jgi:hypothetical protein
MVKSKLKRGFSSDSNQGKFTGTLKAGPLVKKQRN